MFDDDYLRKRAEQLRVSAGDSYRKAAKYDEQGNGNRAAEERRSAEWSTRKAEVYERSVGRRWDAMSMAWITSADADLALKLLDRIDRASAEELFSGADLDRDAEYGFEALQGKACAWAMANELREGAVSGVVDEVRRMEERGVEVNIAAVARMTGISRQTLHARLSAARPFL
ncbi:hypothetical protein [Streptomyces sp. NPDC059708]|uniref:hypothetical protein n=1 Tax=Streptomyces sp. NPDC059708 TaxID=3346916 RepID=UPI0036A52187